MNHIEHRVVLVELRRALVADHGHRLGIFGQKLQLLLALLPRLDQDDRRRRRSGRDAAEILLRELPGLRRVYVANDPDGDVDRDIVLAKELLGV